ncbi:hypothetical protein F5Y06DRAFT_138947 [Hypoxylon sp. FL0890]|nr:hypothetical protein F5Y06DRAFT_138947 [Hypoxylon sp. FL0890]
MNCNLAIKWAGRMRPRLLSGPRAASLRVATRISQQQHQNLSRVAHTPIAQRQFSSFSPLRNNESQNVPAGEPQPQPPSSPPKRGSLSQLILFNIAGLTAIIITALIFKSANSSPDDSKNAVINKTSFSPFTITSKEQVSPTAFVLTIRPGEALKGRSWEPLKQAWDHGLWSVEVKQPQLQIARRYTPLPSSPSKDGTEGNGGENGNEELRFLVRKLDGGEMSTYLSKLGVGDQVWLRGPHLGFDVERRLGDAEDVVFVAGGTGIAPALQVARRLLEDDGQREKRGEKPTISILWANRRAADALGRQQPQFSSTGKGSWFSSLLGRKSPSNAKEEQMQPEESSLARQIREMQQKHPNHFQISYFVDEEGTFIKSRDLISALGEAPKVPLLPAARLCPWHSAAIHESLPDDNDANRHALPCACVQGKKNVPTETKVGANLICVSGPDGFIEAYAGPKRWYRGNEMQGPVRGLLGRIVKEMEGENWLVLKL